jgi:transcriptional regulator with XRE-family HTH domain
MAGNRLVHEGSSVRMRQLILELSQEKLGNALGLTFQQVQKYERGANHMGASQLHQMSRIVQVPIPFFFEGAPTLPGAPVGNGAAPSPNYVSEVLATSDGLALTKASMRMSSRSSGGASFFSSKRSRATATEHRARGKSSRDQNEELADAIRRAFDSTRGCPSMPATLLGLVDMVRC